MTADGLKHFVADLARPFAIYATAGAAAISTVRLAWSSGDLGGAAVYIGAVYAGLASLYGFRAWENRRVPAPGSEIDAARSRAPASRRSEISPPGPVTAPASVAEPPDPKSASAAEISALDNDPPWVRPS